MVERLGVRGHEDVLEGKGDRLVEVGHGVRSEFSLLLLLLEDLLDLLVLLLRHLLVPPGEGEGRRGGGPLGQVGHDHGHAEVGRGLGADDALAALAGLVGLHGLGAALVAGTRIEAERLRLRNGGLFALKTEQNVVRIMLSSGNELSQV